MIQQSVGIAMAVAVVVMSWWSGTQTPTDPTDSSDALRVQ